MLTALIRSRTLLKLEGLSLAGFKSFADRTDIVFPDGITCVVGPNGCGKSNVVDAVAWVLGEQSPRMLRGSRMEEVIFAGTRSRKPAGMAEVNLMFSPKALPADLSEDDVDSRLREPMTITRRLYRNGDSEYLINGERSRLKDIQQLIMGTGMGTRVYSIIEQGRVGQILQAKPTDRRILIEEAAGITRYKAKRKHAKLKLDESEQNLLRVSDIMGEVDKQVRSLKRQVGTAKRYRRLNGRRRIVLKALHAVKYRSHAESLAELDHELAELRSQASESHESLSGLEASARGASESVGEIEARRDHVSQQSHGLHLELDRSRHVVESARERLQELHGRIAAAMETRQALVRERDEAERESARFTERLGQLEAELQAARKRLESQNDDSKTVREKLAAAHRDIADVKETIFEVMSESAGLRNRKQEIEAGMGRLQVMAERLSVALAETDAEVSRLREEMASGDARLQSALEHESGLKSRLASVSAGLEGAISRATALRRQHEEATAEMNDAEWKLAAVAETIRTRASWGAAVREFLESPPDGVLGAVADYLVARDGDELAVEKGLGPLLQAAVMSSREAAERVARDLADERKAEITFVFPDKHAPEAVAAPSDKRILGTLADAVTFSKKSVQWLKGVVPHAWLCESSKDALALSKKHPDHSFVSRDGVLIGPGGQGSAGRPLGEGDGILETRAKAERLEKQAAEHRGHVASIAAGLAAAETEREELSAERLRLQVALAGAEKEAISARHALAALRQNAQAAESRQASARAEHDAATSELAALGERLNELTMRLAAASAKKADLERRLQRTNELTGRLETDVAGSEAELSRLREEVAVKAERREAAKLDAARVGAERDRRLAQEAEMAAQLEGLERDRQETEENLARAEEAIGSGSLRWETMKQELEAAEAAVRDGRAGLLENAERLRDLRLEHERRARLVAESEVRRERLSSELEHCIADCTEKLGCDPSELPLPEPPPEAVAEVKPKRRRRRAAEEEASSVAVSGENAENAENAQDAATAIMAVAEPAAEAVADDDESDAPIDESLPWREGVLDVGALDAESEDLRKRLDRIGPVNLVAIEEYDELEKRHAFLSKEQADLVESIRSLRATIVEIDEMSRERFHEAFEQIRVTFDQAFQTLFRGGRAELRLQEDEQDPLECGIEIIAQPPGKRLQNMMLLSGGEKALTAIALLFALFRFKPSPFCILDEVDAPLDESNTVRFLDLVEEMAKETQFVLVTHARRSMERGKVLYGVTMQEPGASKLVGVKFDEIGDTESSAA